MSLKNKTSSLGTRVGQAVKSDRERLDALEARINDRHTLSSPLVERNLTTTWEDKINGTVPVDGGEYLLTVSYGWNFDATNNDFGSRLLVNGTEIHKGDELHRQEPKDSVGTFTEDGAATATNQKYGFMRAFPITLTAGDVDLQLQWKSFLNNAEASIWDAHIILERKSL